jgi:hypothetical protein
MQTILKIPGFMDNAFTHLLAGLGAGLFAVFIGSPVDVVGSTPSHSFLISKLAVSTRDLDEHLIVMTDLSIMK